VNVSSRPLAVLAVGAVGAVAAAGCGSSSIDQSDEVHNAQKFLSSALPDLPEAKSVDCPSGVSTKVGTAFACTATLSDGQKVSLPYVVKTSTSNGGTMALNPKLVNEALAAALIYHDASPAPKTINCPTDVPAKVGKTFDCKVALVNGKTDTVTIHIDTAAANGNQHLTIVHVSQT
jgi:hypothetical protein